MLPVLCFPWLSVGVSFPLLWVSKSAAFLTAWVPSELPEPLLLTSLQLFSKSQVSWFLPQGTLNFWEEFRKCLWKGEVERGIVGDFGITRCTQSMCFHDCGRLLFVLLGIQPKGQDTVLSVLFTGTLKNPAPASQVEEDTASEEDQLPLQLLKSQ